MLGPIMTLLYKITRLSPFNGKYSTATLHTSEEVESEENKT